MAIVTLPYPNMDFVPLDVLTADELDQIVANIDAINNASIPTDSIANSAITTAKLADDSVTSDKIDWTTLTPYWKVVATSSSSTVTFPAGYRLYRVRLVGRKTSTNTWGVITCPQATGTTWIYIQGNSAGTWIVDERGVTASSDKAIMDGARGNTPSGLQSWDIIISRPDASGTECVATWETCTVGSTTFNVGRSSFNVTSGTTNLTLSSELSSALWSVEALVES